jgi:hypothetical protein
MPLNDKDTKLSQLFQLKKSLEQPNREFWSCFDVQLRQKFLERETKILFWAKWCNIIPKWMVYARSLTYAMAACFVLFLGIIQFNMSKVETLHPFQASLPSADIMSFPKTWTDATLTFNGPSTGHTHYICDRMHASRLNSKTKELAF